MPRRKILLISYLFPPAGGITVQRALSFAKYLPRLDWEVHVLAAQNASAPVRDPGLLKHIPNGVHLHSAFTPEIPFAVRQKLWSFMQGRKSSPTGAAAPKSSSRESLPARIAKRIFCPEPEIFWVPFAFRKAKAIVEEHGIDTVLVTVPPFSALVVGTKLKAAFPKVQLVSDFRDEWLSFYLKDYDFQSGDRTYKKASAIERAAVEASDVVVAVTPTSLAKIRDRYPDQPDSKFKCIHNGFDPEVFQDFEPRQHNTGKVVVTHMGTAYKTASPRYFLDAVDQLPAELRSRFETRFIGRISEAERTILENRLSGVRLLGFMPQTEALKRVEETDYLLLTMTNEISLPGKLFEYLATGKPILALSPAGSEVDRMVRELKLGRCVDPYDQSAIEDMLRAAAEKRIESEASAEDIQRFERPVLAGLLSELLNRRTATPICLKGEALCP